MQILIATLVIVTLAAISDYRTGTIPNGLTLPVLVIAPLIHGFMDGTPGLIASMIGLFGCGLIPYVLFRFEALGGGDVKLFGALGALNGLAAGCELLFVSFLVATAYAMVLLAIKGQLGQSLKASLRLTVNAVVPKRLRQPVDHAELTELRLGPSIAIATVLVTVLG